MDGFYQWGADPRVWRRVVEVDLTRQRDDEYAVETGALGARAIRLDVDNRMSDDLILRLESEIARLTSSRFWGVSWDCEAGKWLARYTDANSKMRTIGRYASEDEAARAVNAAIRRAGLEGKRNINAVDATGALVPRERTRRRGGDRAAVVAPDPASDPSATTSKFWGVTWHKGQRRWAAQYKDANGKKRPIGYFDTQEAAARAYNAAIRRAGLEDRRKTNPVVDGQLVPPARKRKYRSEEPAAAPSPRARRPRRAVNYDDSEPDADEE